LPAGTLFQPKDQGDDAFSTSLVVPLKNSTLLTVPSGSEALAEIEMLAGAVNELPETGFTMAITGG